MIGNHSTLEFGFFGFFGALSAFESLMDLVWLVSLDPAGVAAKAKVGVKEETGGNLG